MLREYSWARRQQHVMGSYREIVVASEYMRDEYARYYPAGRINTIHHFVERRALPAAPRDVDVAFLGRMTPLKGAGLLLDALERAVTLVGRRLTAVFAGEGPERAALGARAQALAADGRVRVTLPGWLETDARDALLARTRVLAVPSRWPEPFGLVGLEAGVQGVPSVAFDVGGIGSWLAHGVNGLLVPLSTGADGFGAALALPLSDAALLAHLSSGARARAASASADTYVAALERVLVRSM
jgi:glycosyltransferase involved in cell wall biosynthesis